MPRISLGEVKGEIPVGRDKDAEAAENINETVTQGVEKSSQEGQAELQTEIWAEQTAVDTELKEKSGKSPLTAFSAYPAGVFFSGEGEDETIIILLRAHIVTNIPWLIVAFGAVLVPLIVFPVLAGFNVFPSVGMGTQVFVTLLWYAGIFTYSFINFLYWYFNIYLVTSERVVDIDWYSLLYQKVSSTGVAHIEDVTATHGGVIAGLFDFGNIYIQTAGTQENFEFANIPHPQLVVKKIEDLMQKEEEETESKSP